MKLIEVYEGKGKQPFRWHKITGTRITSDSGEGYSTYEAAVRAAHSEAEGTEYEVRWIGSKENSALE